MAGMPRFRLRQLLLSMTIASIGLGMISFAIDPRGLNWPEHFAALPSIVVICGCFVVGFGVAAPLRQPKIGAMLSIVLFFWLVTHFGTK
jgi:hypothetical protein